MPRCQLVLSETERQEWVHIRPLSSDRRCGPESPSRTRASARFFPLNTRRRRVTPLHAGFWPDIECLVKIHAGPGGCDAGSARVASAGASIAIPPFGMHLFHSLAGLDHPLNPESHDIIVN